MWRIYQNKVHDDIIKLRNKKSQQIYLSTSERFMFPKGFNILINKMKSAVILDYYSMFICYTINPPTPLPNLRNKTTSCMWIKVEFCIYYST